MFKYRISFLLFCFQSALLLLLPGCAERAVEEPLKPENNSGGKEKVIQLGGEESIITLPAPINSSKLDMRNADFMTVMSDGRVYCERNDGMTCRTACIYYNTPTGTLDSIIYYQTPAPLFIGNSLVQFYKHYGIGYSYNAIGGNSCNLRDFKCQILNRAVIENLEEKEGVNLLNVNVRNEVEEENSVYTSLVDYVASVNIDASVSGDLVFFSGSASKVCAIFEEGTKEQYILHNKISTVNSEYSLNFRDIRLYAKDTPQLLTSSFRNALSKITDNKSIDDFIYNYGTHVVISSKIGASLALDVQVDRHIFSSKEYEEALSKSVIKTLFKSTSSSASSQSNYTVLKDSKCIIDVKGGDLSLFDVCIGLNSFNNVNIPANLSDRWLESIYYDDKEISKSNVELIDIKVIPIWEFIPDDALAHQVEARITGNMKLILDKFVNRNFINTSFESNPTSVTCRIGDKKNQTFQNPDIVEVIAANRHVAAICRELVPEISTKEKVQVAYPIYEGKIKLNSGLCIYSGKAYSVAWSYDNFKVKEIDLGEREITPGRMYMNCGVLSPYPSENLSYLSSSFILGCERPGGIGIDGSLQGNICKVFKYFGHFYLDTKTRYDNLPGWEFVTSPPSLSSSYNKYFNPSDYSNRMMRNDDYTYLINLTEIGYQ
ncbi:MAG: hypothetical protein K2J82_08070 [Muribaculaceae bacterium]|nr:hypothetical protein [Muribaculaceae bacterium]MDE6754552.1 hypothetical protein [Muribaculaceae bacterium]